MDYVCKYADKEGRKNNVRESYGDRTLVVKGPRLPPFLEEIWNSLEGEGLTALVNIIRKYDYETRSFVVVVASHDTFTLRQVVIPGRRT